MTIPDDHHAIIRDFPEIFTVPLYFECGNGWLKLIRDLCENLRPLIHMYNVDDFGVRQVKSKFGELRFYVTFHHPKTAELIRIAEMESVSICERCGGPLVNYVIECAECIKHHGSHPAE